MVDIYQNEILLMENLRVKRRFINLIIVLLQETISRWRKTEKQRCIFGVSPGATCWRGNL